MNWSSFAIGFFLGWIAAFLLAGIAGAAHVFCRLIVADVMRVVIGNRLSGLGPAWGWISCR